MNNRPINVAIAGLGTVGLAVLKILKKNQSLINKKAARKVIVKAVSARNKNKDRGIDLANIDWVMDPVSLAKRQDIDLIIEVVGGAEGTAKNLVESALQNGKHIVTANKALIASHGNELAKLADTKQLCLKFEAAVAGAIPVVKCLLESLSSNEVSRILGVMNGTCNYILTRMEATGQSYESVFSEAKALGYVEADPTLDVGGIDAAQKLAILSAIAFQCEINFNNVEIEGIEKVSIVDIENAKSMGYRIKLIGVTQKNENGIFQEVQPCLVPRNCPIAKLEGGTNMVLIDTDFIGQTAYSGPGAGGGPTASAVIADIIDIARGNTTPMLGVPTELLSKNRKVKNGLDSCYYLRFTLIDRPGTLAKVASVLGENMISIDRMRQTQHDGDEAPLLIVTHKAARANLDLALSKIESMKVCLTKPVAIKIEEI